MESAIRLLFPASLEPADVERWCQQGFVFSAFEGTSRFGLVQARGGPCGVLAVVQAYLFADALYSTHRVGTLDLSEEQREAALVRALATVLLRCGRGESAAVVMLDESDMEEEEAAETVSSAGGRPRADNLTVLEADGAVGAEVCVRAALPQLQSPMGAALFVLSAVLSRGVDEVREDMDDTGAGLTANYGHCTQELMNLLLTGYATGNVHDGAKAMGESGLTLRGVVARQSVGYLTFLEALRYVQVGSHYKAPRLPIWVVGSESHYTVLCADAHVPGVTMNTAGQELFAASKRSFDASDAASNGFVPRGEVGALLLAHAAALRAACAALDAVAHARAAEWSAQLGALRERLDAKASETGGILLWSNFREETLALLAGRFLPRGAPPAGAAGSGPIVVAPDQIIVASLMSMGLMQSGCERAAVATANAGVQEATNYYFSHSGDAGFFAPLAGAGAGAGAVAALSPAQQAWSAALDPADVASAFDTEALVRRLFPRSCVQHARPHRSCPPPFRALPSFHPLLPSSLLSRVRRIPLQSIFFTTTDSCGPCEERRLGRARRDSRCARRWARHS